MDIKTKLGLGAIMGILGSIGIILAPTLGATALGRPWSFIVGFLVGVTCGIGVTLTIAGLLELRREN